VKIGKNAIDELAKYIRQIQEREDKPSGKSTAGSTLQAYYTWWREQMTKDMVIRLDPQRAFNADQQAEIRKRDGSKCAICNRDVSEDEAEYDHFPVPHRDGGPTVVENGRLVHRDCHPRGRPAEGF
jgi:hypothetical protein